MKEKSFIDATKDALNLSMKMDKNVIVFGLGVGNSSNIYGSTEGLKEKFGKKRVFDTPSSESALTAMAAGMSLDGLRPVLIHQRFDFMIYSLDQIVNWISLWSYKSGGKSQMPITIRAVVGKVGDKDHNTVNLYTHGFPIFQVFQFSILQVPLRQKDVL